MEINLIHSTGIIRDADFPVATLTSAIKPTTLNRSRAGIKTATVADAMYRDGSFISWQQAK